MRCKPWIITVAIDHGATMCVGSSSAGGTWPGGCAISWQSFAECVLIDSQSQPFPMHCVASYCSGQAALHFLQAVLLFLSSLRLLLVTLFVLLVRMAIWIAFRAAAYLLRPHRSGCTACVVITYICMQLPLASVAGHSVGCMQVLPVSHLVLAHAEQQ
jgi:hypothetical protein